MNNLLHENHNNSDDDSGLKSEVTELSELELCELMTTRFFEEDTGLEVARDVHSPIHNKISPIEHLGEDDVLLEDCCYTRRSVSTDGANNLLSRILEASHEQLTSYKLWRVFEVSRHWKNTSRTTELALIKSTISLVDHRPIHMHVFCRRLVESDIFEIIREALEVPPPTEYRSLHRTTIKTEMPLRQFLENLDSIASELQDVNMKGWQQLGSQRHPPKKYETCDIEQFSVLEHFLTKTEITATTKLWLSTHGRPYIDLNVEFLNDIHVNGRRHKTIIIEQVVTPIPGTVPGKRVTFGSPELVQVHEFEIGDNAPFHSLSLSMTKSFDLVDQLQVQNFKNVTFR